MGTKTGTAKFIKAGKHCPPNQATAALVDSSSDKDRIRILSGFENSRPIKNDNVYDIGSYQYGSTNVIVNLSRGFNPNNCEECNIVVDPARNNARRYTITVSMKDD